MPAAYLTLTDINLAHKTVLLRADLNVPMKDGKVEDSTRLERLLPTLKAITAKGAKIAILSHFGRPKGNWPDPALSLKPVADALSRLYGAPVAFAENCIGDKAKQAIAALPAGGIVVLENTRFHGGEEKNDPSFVLALSQLGQVFINDGFSVSHRAHASTAGLADALPAAAGLLMQAELDALTKALTFPTKPVAAIVGGSKISTKLDLFKHLIEKIDVLILGGGMANTFLAARNVQVGESLCERDMFQNAREIMAKAVQKGCTLVLPIDVVIAKEMVVGAPSQTVSVQSVPRDAKIFDIGPQTVANIVAALKRCRTLVWNGPLGVIEIPDFAKGTIDVAKAVAAQTQNKHLMSVAGGGDTIAGLNQAGVMDQLSYVSTAGGAFLEWLEGKTLPGVQALERAALKYRKSLKI